MAAAFVPSPGKENGPCAAPCQHRDCADSRAVAATDCRFCFNEIGYETRFYNDGGYAHAACLEDSIEAQLREQEDAA